VNAPDTDGLSGTTADAPEGATQSVAPQDDRRVRAARRAFMITWPIALAAIILAIALNWFFAPAANDPLPGRVGEEPIPEPGEVVVSESVVDFLPERVLSYETITRQAVPGQEMQSAEAVYNSLNMDLVNARPQNSYSRVERTAGSAEAERRASEMLAPYSLDQKTILAGQDTPAREGWAPDESAWTVVWTRGDIVYLVKTSYLDTPPVQRTRELLLNNGTPVVDAVADYVPTDSDDG
jgi:hypothetical protein